MKLDGNDQATLAMISHLDEAEVNEPAPTFDELKAALHPWLAQLQDRDLQSFSMKTVRLELETRMGLAEGGLDNRRVELKSLAQAFVAECVAVDTSAAG